MNMNDASKHDDAKDGIFGEVRAEREAQDGQWGGPDHDDAHTRDGDGDAWPDYISAQLKKLAGERTWAVAGEGERRVTRARLVKIAALAVAGIESIDRVNADQGQEP